MSWTPDLIIGELRPWPDAVWVIRDDTDEARRYVPEDGVPSVPMDEVRDFFYRCVPSDIERWRDEDFQRVAHFFGAKVVDLREKSQEDE